MFQEKDKALIIARVFKSAMKVSLTFASKPLSPSGEPINASPQKHN
jgi:hypothetical protein